MSTTPNIIETALLTSYPPDITVLQSANDVLNDVIDSQTPFRTRVGIELSGLSGEGAISNEPSQSPSPLGS